jgi:cell division transport system ATP-binding protein
MSLLKINNLTKVYNHRTVALDSVSLEIERGELVFLFGPNGAGKTTLFKLIISDEKPTSGEIIFDGVSSSKMKAKKIPYLRQKIGIMFQDQKFLEKRELFENLAISLRVLGEREKRVKKKVTETLGWVGLSKKRNSLPEELSDGERQKLSFARAIIRSPLVFLADEPTSGLDSLNSNYILELIRKINSLGTTVMVATNQLSLVENHPARIIHLDNGKIVG